MLPSITNIHPVIHWAGTNPDMFSSDIPLRRVGDSALFCVTAGLGRACVGDRTHALSRGDVLFVRPLITHSIQDIGGLGYIWIHFDFFDAPEAKPFSKDLVGRDVAQLEQGFSRRPTEFFDAELPVLTTFTADSGALELASSIVSELKIEQITRDRDCIASLMAATHLQELIALCAVPARSMPSAMNRRYERQIKWILSVAATRLGSDPIPTVAEIAESLNISVRQLHRACRASFGASPKALIDRVRFDRACFLLCTDYPTITIGGIATCCGFDDALYFSRWFRFRAGMPPSEYALAMSDFSI